jgi:hypothetical protein
MPGEPKVNLPNLYRYKDTLAGLLTGALVNGLLLVILFPASLSGVALFDRRRLLSWLILLAANAALAAGLRRRTAFLLGWFLGGALMLLMMIARGV